MALQDPMENKPERLEARIPARQKRLFQKAADLQGQSLTDFMLSHLQEAAERIIRAHEVMELSERDSILFVETLLTPPEPNAALQEAVKRYQQRLAGQ